MEGCTEVPVLVDELGGETHDDIRCRALVAITVTIINDSVSITVNIKSLNWFAILVVNLLVNIERIDRLSNLVCLYFSVI